MKRHALTLIAGLLLAAGCEPPDDLITNFEVDSWCGDTPCGWQVDGRIERVDTWHSHDYAVSLASDDAALYQVNEDASSTIGCIAFSMIAKVQPGAKVYVELDFLNDGHVEWSKPVPPGDFQTYEFYVTPPPWFEGIRFIVRKDGPGEVVLAKLRALDDWDAEECTAPAVQLKHAPALAPCSDDEQCALGMCDDGVCIGCTTDDDCEGEQVCGYAPVGSAERDDVVMACIDGEGERRLGQICVSDGECSTGICCAGTCSECCDDVACAGSGECEASVTEIEHQDFALPQQCDPGLRERPAGEDCMADADCESGHCSSPLCTGPCSFDLVEECARTYCPDDECTEPTCEIWTVRAGHCD